VFQTRVVTIWKTRSPTVDIFDVGTANVSDDHDRSRYLDGMSLILCRSTDRYAGANPCRHRYTRTAIITSIGRIECDHGDQLVSWCAAVQVVSLQNAQQRDGILTCRIVDVYVEISDDNLQIREGRQSFHHMAKVVDERRHHCWRVGRWSWNYYIQNLATSKIR